MGCAFNRNLLLVSAVLVTAAGHASTQDTASSCLRKRSSDSAIGIFKNST